MRTKLSLTLIDATATAIAAAAEPGCNQGDSQVSYSQMPDRAETTRVTPRPGGATAGPASATRTVAEHARYRLRFRGGPGTIRRALIDR